MKEMHKGEKLLLQLKIFAWFVTNVFEEVQMSSHLSSFAPSPLINALQRVLTPMDALINKEL